MANSKLLVARILKIWFDIVLVLGTIGLMLMLAWVLLSPLVLSSEQKSADAAIWVGLGQGVFRPVLELESIDTRGQFSTLRLINTRGELRFETSQTPVYFAVFSGRLVAVAMMLLVAFLIRQILTEVLKGAPFTISNAKRLHWIGWIVVGAGVILPLANYLAGVWILNQIGATDMPLAPTLAIHRDWILAGLFVLLLSTLFRHGVELEQEKSLTI
jgi:hypothetical protein